MQANTERHIWRSTVESREQNATISCGCFLSVASWVMSSIFAENGTMLRVICAQKQTCHTNQTLIRGGFLFVFGESWILNLTADFRLSIKWPAHRWWGAFPNLLDRIVPGQNDRPFASLVTVDGHIWVITWCHSLEDDAHTGFVRVFVDFEFCGLESFEAFFTMLDLMLTDWA